MISSRDLLSFNDALLELYAPGLDLGNYPDRGFRFLKAIAEVDLAVYGASDPRRAGRNFLLRVDRVLPEAEQAVSSFGRLAGKYPWFSSGGAVPDGHPHYRSDFCSDREYRGLDIHAEVFRRWGLEHFMSMCVEIRANGVTFFGCSRAARDFTWSERALLARARPHLAAAHGLATALGAAQPGPASPAMFAGGGFTPREAEVLYWLTEGKSNVEIAAILRLGLPTVKGYLTAIFNKTGTGNRLAATLHALELAREFRRRQAASPDGPLLFTVPSGEPPTKVG